MGKPEATHLRVALPSFSAVCGTVNSVTYGATEKGRGRGDQYYYNKMLVYYNC